MGEPIAHGNMGEKTCVPIHIIMCYVTWLEKLTHTQAQLISTTIYCGEP